MQNVAQAYRQTQAGTTGQGEIVVMLFDGALRFLSQAREKMEARDYAGKGILISRTLDILNELDSSLNTEAGGELAKNLHQLYFMCTSRLLQANLRLDTEKLDSVTTILSGLRDAFAQAIVTPEARAACAQISARQAGKQAGSMPRPLVSPAAPLGGMARGAVAGLYAQAGGARMPQAHPQTPPQAGPGLASAGVRFTSREQAAERARELHAMQAAREAHISSPAPAPTPPHPSMPEKTSVVSPAARPAAPASGGTGFAGKKLIGKLQLKH